MSCREWDIKGTCKLGDKCRYKHSSKPEGGRRYISIFHIICLVHLQNKFHEILVVFATTS